MTQAIRKTTFVQSEGKIEIQSSKLPEGAKVEVIVIFEDDSEIMSAEALAIKRLNQLNDSIQLITVIESDQEIDEDELKQWVASHGSST